MITKESLIGEVIAKHHEKVIPIFVEFGFHCMGCMMARSESIEDGARAHGFTDKQIDELVKQLNKATGMKAEKVVEGINFGKNIAQKKKTKKK